MNINIVAARPTKEIMLTLVEKALEISKEGKKVGFVLALNTTKEVPEYATKMDNLLILEKNYYMKVEEIEGFLVRESIDVLFLESFDVLLTEEGKALVEDEDFKEVYDSIGELSDKYSIPIHFGRGLTREIDIRSDKRPKLTDLKGHEKEATTILGLYSDDFYGSENTKKSNLEYIDLKNGSTLEEHSLVD